MSYNFSSFAPYDMKLSEIRAEARRKTEDFLKRVVHEAQSHLRRFLNTKLKIVLNSVLSKVFIMCVFWCMIFTFIFCSET